jgi:hypothetical protein
MLGKLYEYRDFDSANVLLERSNDGKDLYMKGIFVQAEVKNQNQRVYPLREISKAVELLNDRIKVGGGVPGELDHPEELSINLDRVSHVITEMWMDGHNGMGRLKLIPTTPCGTIAKALLEASIKLGVSSRGSGNVDYNGMVSDFEMVTVDIVAQPSAPDAYPKSIYESLFNMRGGQLLYNTASGVAHGDPSASKYLHQDLVKFIRELKLK